MRRSVLTLVVLICRAVYGRPLELAGLPIMLPAGRNGVEQFAGEELGKYLARMSGKAFLSSTISVPLPAAAIVIGRAPAEQLGIRFSTAKYGDDGFILSHRGDRIILAGISPRGTLYAVYALLEQLGCRWFAPNFAFYGPATGEWVPHLARLQIDELESVEKPGFRWRKKYVEEGRSHTAENLKQMIDWMAKARMNVFDCPIDYQHEGKTRWDNWRKELTLELRKRGILIEVGGHGYPNFLPADRYFEQHPDWFGMLKGERSRAPNVVFSTANEGAMHEFIANVRTYLSAHPEVDIFDCWPPDGARWSEAPEDVALGNPTERHMLLLSRLARELEPAFPSLKFQFIAYSTYLNPPKINRPPRNLVMEFCPIDRSFESALFEDKAAINQEYFRALQGWVNGVIDPENVTIYSYVTKYAWQSLPILIPYMIAAESKRYREMGIGGWATYSEPARWATYELDHYFVARYAWNAELDPAKEVADYTAHRYRQCAGPVAKYLELVERVVPHAVGIPGTELELEKQRRWIAQFRPSAGFLEEAKRLAGADADLAGLIDQLDGSRRYVENEMQLRFGFLEIAKMRARYGEIEKLLAERRRIIEEYGKTGVIDGSR